MFPSFEMSHQLYGFSLFYGSFLGCMTISFRVYLLITLTTDVTIWCWAKILCKHNISKCGDLTPAVLHSYDLEDFLCVWPLKREKNLLIGSKKMVHKWGFLDSRPTFEQIIRIFIHIEAHAYHVCCVYLRIYYVKSVYKWYSSVHCPSHKEFPLLLRTILLLQQGKYTLFNTFVICNIQYFIRPPFTAISCKIRDDIEEISLLIVPIGME